MKTKEQVEAALECLERRLTTPGLSDLQLTALSGLTNALCWVLEKKIGEPYCIDGFLAGAPPLQRVDAAKSLKELRKLANEQN